MNIIKPGTHYERVSIYINTQEEEDPATCWKWVETLAALVPTVKWTALKKLVRCLLALLTLLLRRWENF